MARSFNGSSDLIKPGNLFNFTTGGTFSCACWVNYTGATGLLISDSWVAAGNQNSWTFFLISNKLKFDYAIGAALGILSGSSTISTGVWHHVGMSFNNKTVTIYIDGAQDASGVATGAGTGTMSTATYGSVLGTGFNTTNATFTTYYTGNMADVAVWNVALTASEFSALSKGLRPHMVRSAALVGFWPLDGLQSPEPDLSGLAHNGTLTGTALAAGPPMTLFTPRRPQFLTPPVAAGGFFSRYYYDMMQGQMNV